jgi:hypothetical protein
MNGTWQASFQSWTGRSFKSIYTEPYEPICRAKASRRRPLIDKPSNNPGDVVARIFVADLEGASPEVLYSPRHPYEAMEEAGPGGQESQAFDSSVEQIDGLLLMAEAWKSPVQIGKKDCDARQAISQRNGGTPRPDQLPGQRAWVQISGNLIDNSKNLCRRRATDKRPPRGAWTASS